MSGEGGTGRGSPTGADRGRRKGADADGGRRAAAGTAPPETVEEALGRARRHGRIAAAEAVAATRSLLDAAALASSGRASAAHPWLSRPAGLLDQLERELGGGGPMADALLESVAESLDAEIARWEERARQDGDARAVLRAFLGLRELLWEFGVRPGQGPSEPDRNGGPRRPATRARSRRARVQRVEVES